MHCDCMITVKLFYCRTC